MDNSDETIKTMNELAKILGLSQPRISQMKAQGMPVNADGSYNVKEIMIWRASRAAEKVKTLLPSTIENGELDVIDGAVAKLNCFLELVDDFKKDRGNIFAGVEAKLIRVTEDILSGVTQSEILRIPLKERLKLVKDIVSSINTLYTAERLENNQSTENIQIIVSQIKDLKRRRAEERRAQEEKKESFMVQDVN